MRFFIAGVLLSLSTSFSFAQNMEVKLEPIPPKDGIIKGMVIDSGDGKPMEFTSVAIFKVRDSSLVTGSITGPDGSFLLKDLSFGKYYMVANYMGYEKQFINDIILSPSHSIAELGKIKLVLAKTNLKEVEVIADQAHVEYKLDRKIVNVGQDINATSGTAADVLQNTPSVQVDIEGNVSLRGSSNFTVLIDGKPTPLSGSDALQQIPASAIQNIEIITNPSAKYDPDGMAGIINIVSKKNLLQGFSGLVNLRLGTRDKYSTDFLLNYRTKRFNFYTGASYRDDNYHGSSYSLSTIDIADTLRYTEMDGSRGMNRGGYEIKGGVDFFLNDKNNISLTGEFGQHEFGFGGNQKIRYWNEPSSFNLYTVNDNYSAHGGNYYEINLNYQHKFNDKGHQLIAFANYSKSIGNDYDEQFEYPTTDNFDYSTSVFNEKTKGEETGDEDEVRIQADYTLPINDHSRFEAGYQARLDIEYEGFTFRRYDFQEQQMVIDPLYTNATDFYRNIQSVYSTYNNSIGKYEFLLGLRGEMTDRRIETKQSDEPATIQRFDLFPTFHLSRSFKKEHQLMVSYSRRINRPRGWYLEPFESYIDAYTRRRGDPGLKPEYVNSFELGYQKTFGRSFISFEAYYKNTVDKIDRLVKLVDPENSIYLYTYGNVAEDQSLGTELMLNYSQLKWLEMNASTSVYRYILTGKLENVNIDRKSTNWNARFDATFNITSKTRLQAQTFYNGPSVSIQGESKGYFYSNIAFRHDFLDRKLSATLQLQDIFGSMKHEMSSYGNNFNTFSKFGREPRVLMLSLSYKINNFKQERQQSRSGGEMDMGGEGEGF